MEGELRDSLEEVVERWHVEWVEEEAMLEEDEDKVEEEEDRALPLSFSFKTLNSSRKSIRKRCLFHSAKERIARVVNMLPADSICSSFSPFDRSFTCPLRAQLKRQPYGTVQRDERAKGVEENDRKRRRKGGYGGEED
jgi:hypothetical protein